MDLNLVALCGRLAAPPELTHLDSGASRIRLLLAVRSMPPAPRIDLLPVIMWKPPDELLTLESNERVWVTGMLQRRFWEAPGPGRRASSVQVVAHRIDRRAIDRRPAEKRPTEPHPVS